VNGVHPDQAAANQALFDSVDPFLLEIQRTLLEREIDVYTITQAPNDFLVELGQFQVTLSLRPKQQIAKEIRLDGKMPGYVDFLAVRELPGDDQYRRSARVFLKVVAWREEGPVIHRTIPDNVFHIVLRFLHRICMTFRWYLYVPWPAGLHAFPIPPRLDFIMELKQPAPEMTDVGYVAFITPGVPSDAAEAQLMKHIRAV